MVSSACSPFIPCFCLDRQGQAKKFLRPQTGTIEAKNKALEKLNMARNTESSFGLFNQPQMMQSH